MTIDRKSLGKRIQAQRKALNLTQAALAERAKLDTAYFSQVERGIKLPSLEALDRIAKALKVAPGALLGGVKAVKDDSLTREVRDILAKWSPKQRKAILKALRALSEM